MNEKKQRGVVILFWAIIGVVALPLACFADADELELSGIMYEAAGQSAAVINGSLVKVGDKIGSAEVLEIGSSSVVVKDSGREIILSTEDPKKPKKDMAGKPAVQKKKNDETGRNFWGQLADKFRLHKKKAPEAPSQARGYHGSNAVEYYEKAEAAGNAKDEMELYEKALKSAQYALETESPSSAQVQELNGIITDSRLKLSQATEFARRFDEMERLKLDGDRYAAKARGISDHDALARTNIRQNYSLALQYYQEALSLADNESGKKNLQDTIIRIEARLDNLE
jgi:hypothetical protein